MSILPHLIPDHVHHLYGLWESLRADCEAQAFRVNGQATKESLKPFDARQRQIDSLYKRLDNHEQGLFHHLVWLDQPSRPL